MKKLVIIIALVLVPGLMCLAQSKLNENADSIVGIYLVPDEGNDSKVEFTKNADGTYDCVIIWLQNPNDPSTGKPWLDVANPKKELRTRPCMGLKLVQGLKYDSAKKNWGGTKIYDPNRGINANVKMSFEADGKLSVRGSLLGIGETQLWIKEQ